MKEIFDEIKIEIPKFVLNFINALTNPRDFLVKQRNLIELNREQSIIRAIIYYTVCCLFTLIWQLPMFGLSVFKGETLFYATVVPLIFLFLGSLAVRISWRIVGFQTSYIDYLVVFAYHMGTGFNIYLFLNFLNISILDLFDQEKFNLVVNNQWLKIKGSPDPYDNILDSSKAFVFYFSFGFISLVGSVWWFYYAWQSYRIMNRTHKKGKSFLAGLIFTGLMVLVFIIDAAITLATKK